MRESLGVSFGGQVLEELMVETREEVNLRKLANRERSLQGGV